MEGGDSVWTSGGEVGVELWAGDICLDDEVDDFARRYIGNHTRGHKFKRKLRTSLWT